jgi:hypothetical protein
MKHILLLTLLLLSLAAYGQKISVDQVGWLTGVGAPSATCSALINNGAFYTDSGPGVLYQCYPVSSVYTWHAVSGGTVGTGCFGGNTIANGCTGATTASGALANLFQAVNVKAYGALGDGSTDDGPAIRAAIAVGADVYFPCSAQPYYINSLAGNFNNNSWALELGSNQTLFSDSAGCATIQMGNGLVNSGGQTYGSGMILLNGVSNVTIKNITIDMNGLNNLVPSGGAIRNAIAIKGQGVTNGTISGVSILNSSGQNGIAFDTTSSYITIKDNYILWGGTTLAGNIHQTDWSALYSEADHTNFLHNTINNGGYPRSQGDGGIEMHGNYMLADGNDIQYADPCFYIDPITTGGSQTQVRIEHTHCTHAYIGVNMVNGYLSNIDVGDNDFSLDPAAWVAAASPGEGAYGIQQYQYLTPNVITDSNFHDNVIIDTDTTLPTDETAIGLEFPNINNSTVHHNTSWNLSGPGIDIEVPTSGISNVTVDHNIIGNFGQNSGIYGHWGILFGSAGAGNVNGLTITDNHINQSASSPTAQAFYFNWNPATTLQDLTISRNDINPNVGAALGGPAAGMYNYTVPGYDGSQWQPGAVLFTDLGDYSGFIGGGTLANMLVYSSVYNNAPGPPWYNNAAAITFTPAYAISPDGTMDAMNLYASVTLHSMYQVVTVTPGPYTFSAFAENNGGTSSLIFAIYCSTTSTYIIQSAEALTSSWQRLSLPFVVPVGCSTIEVYPTFNEIGGVNFNLWGAQLNPGGIATAYAPTGASPVNATEAITARNGLFTNLFVAGTAFGLTGTTGTITGTALTATCDSGTATVTGAVVGHPVSVSSTTGADVGGAFNVRGSVTSTSTVTVYVCGTGTPASLAYNVTAF